MCLPSQEYLQRHIRQDLIRLTNEGRKPEDVASLVLLNYEYVSDRDDFLKLVIYNEVQQYSLKKNLKFPKLEVEIELLKIQLNSSNKMDDFFSKVAATR